jgi:hypothetical protein
MVVVFYIYLIFTFLKEWVDFWFDIMVDSNKQFNNNNNSLINCPNKRMLYIATDESKFLINEANNKWGNRYMIYHSKLGWIRINNDYQ